VEDRRNMSLTDSKVSPSKLCRPMEVINKSNTVGKLDKDVNGTVDYTTGSHHKITTKLVHQGLEANISRFAITQLVKKLSNVKVTDYYNWCEAPSVLVIDIDYNVSAKIFHEIMVVSDEGMIKSRYNRDAGWQEVEFYAEDKSDLTALLKMYNDCLEKSNFFKGKCIKVYGDSIKFMPCPTRTFNDVVLSDKILSEYKNTTIDFLTIPKMQEVCKRRRVILYGPPGSGKTSLISATFQDLTNKGITCVSIGDMTSRTSSIEKFFDFLFRFLAPAYIVFEDIDLIGQSRDLGNNRFIGQLLSIFDGIEQIDKAVVFCSSTNRLEVLDKAFTRPCRVDRKFHLDYMNNEEMGKLFKLLLDVTLPEKMKGVGKITGSHIQEISDTAKLLSKQNGGDPKLHVDHAIDIVLEHFDIIQGNGIGFTSDDNGREKDSELKEVEPPSECSSSQREFRI